MELKCMWVWLILMLTFISSKRWRVESCLKQEKYALLQLKHIFNYFNSIQDSVEGDKDSSDCCQWKRIECSNTTGRVIGLDLEYARDPELGEWNLNVSLFSPFQELERLDLSDNLIVGCVDNEGFERLSHLSNLKGLYLDYNMFNDSHILSALSEHSSLKNLSLAYNHLRELNHFNVSKLNNLEYLDLSGNTFNHSILSYVSTLSSLKELDMYDIGLRGTFDLQELISLSNLKVLYMGGNQINKIVFSKGDAGLRKLYSLYLRNVSISDGNSLFQTLGSLPSLQYFGLWYCNISGRLSGHELPTFNNLTKLEIIYTVIHYNFLQILGSMTSLQSIEIWDSNLNDTLFDQDLPNTFLEQGICKLLHLQYFSITDNDLWGDLPWCFTNLTSLEFVDISSNQFTGDISSSPLKVLTSIQDLRLSNNNFRIPISLEPFFNHSKLKTFYAENIEIYAGIESQYLAPKFQLNSIKFSAYKYNGSFPKFLYSQHDLEEVDLYNLNLKEEFPVWLLNNNTNLRSLNLVNNSLSGPLQLPNHSHMSLRILDISINSFHEHIPNGIGTYLPMLQYLNISRNALHGSIPSSFGDMKLLQTLDLSNNVLTEQIPHQMAMGCLSLQWLALSNNSLHGEIC